jgi:hypothetical protein
MQNVRRIVLASAKARVQALLKTRAAKKAARNYFASFRSTCVKVDKNKGAHSGCWCAAVPSQRCFCFLSLPGERPWDSTVAWWKIPEFSCMLKNISSKQFTNSSEVLLCLVAQGRTRSQMLRPLRFLFWVHPPLGPGARYNVEAFGPPLLLV